MKKNAWFLMLFILIGLIAGALAARWLKQVPGISFLTDTARISWSPAADLLVFSFDFSLRIDISLLSIAGAIIAIWLYRKM
ncbi:hypothetical protein BG53_09490 [Paenibacillus darwinianus]|uniref:DUF4321 domain-containing protein n=1 Tax=Paenibacillus darwinianus TaxID=1380763 RepID=A0A9W5RYS8_9BACL|nr:DUF4321 domain-containing protein [Paenibacillus darwinianus]EXX85130.1 hypothetical protein BG53_09490 [Paenibacillus darwinianus]EXX90106.1 hypothetical protein BG52_14195 [Paenibacillus darwinianus]EXX91349.1 hypothetical protein CH50_13730 [Paenibacillus darwinianus]